MDIVRTDVRNHKKRRLLLAGGFVFVLMAVAGVGIATLRASAPTIDRSSVLVGTVKYGMLIGEVRGAGTLVPKEIRWIATDTAARVEKIQVRPGAAVSEDTVILTLTNPELTDRLAEAQMAANAGQADLAARRALLQSQILDQQANLASAETDFESIRIQVEAEQRLKDSVIISGVQFRRSELDAKRLKYRLEIERQRTAVIKVNVQAQLTAEQARMDQLIAIRDLRQRQVDALQVRAGLSGVLQQIVVEEGQQVVVGSNLARVARPDELIATLHVAETQARDIAIGQAARIDTRNGVVPGKVIRVDPAVQNGTVNVDVALLGPLPTGARPDLSVDGTIETYRLENVMYVGRPAIGQSGSKVELFRVDEGTGMAKRVRVQLGRASANAVEVIAGLSKGDQLILSDTSNYSRFEQIHLE